MLEPTASSFKNSLPGDHIASSSQNSLTGGVVAGSSENPMPGGCDSQDSDLAMMVEVETLLLMVEIVTLLYTGVVIPGSSSSNQVAGILGNYKEVQGHRSLRDGYTYCVPGCYSNTKLNRELSFYRIPKDKVLKVKWINAIKRKDFISSDSHRVCSKHFKNGKKCSRLDVPVISPLLPEPKTRKRPKARKYISPKKRKKEELESESEVSGELVVETEDMMVGTIYT